MSRILIHPRLTRAARQRQGAASGGAAHRPETDAYPTRDMLDLRKQSVAPIAGAALPPRATNPEARMRVLSLVILSGSVLMSVTAQTKPAFPQAEITNGQVRVKLYLPDAEAGYYRGTRFDWSGVISSLSTAHHEYFGQWFPRYDPQLHDSITGPVEEFLYNESALGYESAKAGETFVRIGVGLLRRPAGEERFNRFGYYEIVDGGHRSVRQGPGWIEFTQELATPIGYAYRYTKTLRLAPGAAQLTIEHTLHNTGTKPIRTSQYNHNFFVIDQKATEPAASVRFPFPLVATQKFEGGAAEVHGGEIVYLKELVPEQSVFAEFQGSPNAADYDIRLEQREAGAGVRIRGSRPISKIVYWSIRSTFCPEAYVELDVAPGQTAEWHYEYDFYDLPRAGR
jgi:hypothetical protein